VEERLAVLLLVKVPDLDLQLRSLQRRSGARGVIRFDPL
jgi:hypothetical protein